MRTKELMLYKNMEYGQILKDMTFLMENYDNEYYNKEDLKGLLFECVNALLELSVKMCIRDRSSPCSMEVIHRGFLQRIIFVISFGSFNSFLETISSFSMILTVIL